MSCRLLYLVGQLRDGGSERQLCYLLKSIDRGRYAPHLAVWNFREEDAYASRIRRLGVPIYPVGGRTVKKLRAMRSLVRWLKPEVIHSYSYYTNFSAWYAAAGTGSVPVGSVRSDFPLAVTDAGYARGMLCGRWPRTQIFNSFSAVENARKYPSFFIPRQAFVVRNGIDFEQFRRTPLANNRVAKIVGIGSLVHVKRWDRLLNAAYQLKQKSLKFVLQIVGDGPLRGALEKQAQDLGLRRCTEFIGRSDDIPALLSTATFVVHTSDSEGCPNVVMEAMACARAVVATDVGDVASLIEPGIAGYLVPRSDKSALVECMGKLLVDRDLCRRMGEAGRAKAEQEFGFDRVLQQTLAAYRAAGWIAS